PLASCLSSRSLAPRTGAARPRRQKRVRRRLDGRTGHRYVIASSPLTGQRPLASSTRRCLAQPGGGLPLLTHAREIDRGPRGPPSSSHQRSLRSLRSLRSALSPRSTVTRVVYFELADLLNSPSVSILPIRTVTAWRGLPSALATSAGVSPSVTAVTVSMTSWR